MKKSGTSLALLFVVSSCLSAAPSAAGMFDFVLPWDDSSKTDIDLSYLNHKPAGSLGYVVAGSDGHLYTGNGTERIRFLAVNITSGDCFPGKTEAEAIAKRLAKFGINLVRFHFADSPYGQASYIDYGHFRDSRHLDAANLDKLDYFFSVLKANGIYARSPSSTAAGSLQQTGCPNPWTQWISRTSRSPECSTRQ